MLFDDFQGDRGGRVKKNIPLNVLIRGLQLLGQEDINVLLPHAFQPLGSIADSSQFNGFSETLPPGWSFNFTEIKDDSDKKEED